MAIFEREAKRKPGTRSNTKLFVSGGDAPAEHWITDSELPILFNYDYGGAAQKEVVISKGMAVSIKPDPSYHYESQKNKGVLTIARPEQPGLVGLAPYNFTKHNDDFLDGNQPSIITREYIELPYIPNADDAADVNWGAVHGTIKNGDLVTYSRNANNYGKLVKWEEGTHSVRDILGQVLAMELDQEPWGWLKWAMWDETAKREDLGPQNKSGYAAPGEAGYPFDPDHKDGIIDMDGYLSQYTTNPTGIPGILDGSQKAQTVQSATFDVLTGTAAGTQIQVNLGLKNVVEGSVNVFDGNGAPVSAENFTVNYAKGILTYTVEAEALADATYSVQFRANFFGTPAGWDFRGAVGAIRILLQR